MKKGTKQILLIGGLGVGGYLAYSWWSGRQAAEAEAAGYWPTGYGAGVSGGGFGGFGGLGNILFSTQQQKDDCGPENPGVPEEEQQVITEEGVRVEEVGTTPMGSEYRILESGESEIWNPYNKQWEEIWWPGPAVVKVPGPAPLGELSAELVRRLQYENLGGVPSRGYTLPDVPTTPTTRRLSDLPTPKDATAGVLTGTTPMGTAYRLESLEPGAPSYIYDPYAVDKYGLGGWTSIAYPGPAVVKQPGLRPIGEPSAQAARARAATAARATAALKGFAQTTAQRVAEAVRRGAARAPAAVTPVARMPWPATPAAIARVTEQARVGAARAAAGQIAYPTFAPPKATAASRELSAVGLGEPSARAARAASAARAAARASTAALPTLAPLPITSRAYVRPLVSAPSAAEALIARVPMSGGGVL